MGLVNAIKNLVKGLGITGKHLGRHAITVQYPEERDNIPERSRGIVVLLSDKETGELNCTACELCARQCPTGAIKVVWHKDENKKKHLDQFYVDNGICCFCGLCEEACNFSAIKMATKYEFSVLDKDTLMWDKDKLQEVGRDVDYEDTRKKKKDAAKAKAAAKPATDKPEAKAEKPATDKPVGEKPEAEPAKPDAEAKVEAPAPSKPAEPATEDAPAKPEDKKTEGGDD